MKELILARLVEVLFEKVVHRRAPVLFLGEVFTLLHELCVHDRVKGHTHVARLLEPLLGLDRNLVLTASRETEFVSQFLILVPENVSLLREFGDDFVFGLDGNFHFSFLEHFHFLKHLHLRLFRLKFTLQVPQLLQQL